MWKDAFLLTSAGELPLLTAADPREFKLAIWYASGLAPAPLIFHAARVRASTRAITSLSLNLGKCDKMILNTLPWLLYSKESPPIISSTLSWIKTQNDDYALEWIHRVDVGHVLCVHSQPTLRRCCTWAVWDKVQVISWVVATARTQAWPELFSTRYFSTVGSPWQEHSPCNCRKYNVLWALL